VTKLLSKARAKMNRVSETLRERGERLASQSEFWDSLASKSPHRLPLAHHRHGRHMRVARAGFGRVRQAFHAQQRKGAATPQARRGNRHWPKP
jgi:hypothetical protein